MRACSSPARTCASSSRTASSGHTSTSRARPITPADRGATPARAAPAFRPAPCSPCSRTSPPTDSPAFLPALTSEPPGMSTLLHEANHDVGRRHSQHHQRGLAGLVFASPAQAEPGPFPETLCPFRNVVNALGGDDECNPDYGWGNNPV